MTAENTDQTERMHEFTVSGSKKLWVPSPYGRSGRMGTRELGKLYRHGFAFHEEDLECPNASELGKDGIVSTDRTMVVIFCDLIGSTVALLELKHDFRKVQYAFFKLCKDTIEKLQPQGVGSRGPRGVWPVLDKFMGDCAMFYVDCGKTYDPLHSPECKRWCVRSKQETSGRSDDISHCATGITMGLIHGIVDGFDEHLRECLNGNTDSKTKDTGPPPPSMPRLGLRFGVALGGGVMLSVLGKWPEADFTVTGAIVNLAARLEHATPPEFLDAIAEERASLERFASRVKHDEVLRGTDLWEKLRLCDEQVVHVHGVAQERFQIRANKCFVDCLRHRKRPFEMAWREVAFAARGFRQAEKVFLAGGGSAAELFSIA